MKDTLYGLMRKCGHHLHHNTDADTDKAALFAGLTQEEQDQLKALLTKLLESWK